MSAVAALPLLHRDFLRAASASAAWLAAPGLRAAAAPTRDRPNLARIFHHVVDGGDSIVVF